MTEPDGTNGGKTFADEKRAVADLVEQCLTAGGTPALIQATEDLSEDLLAQSDGSSTKIVIGQIINDLTVMGPSDLRTHLEHLLAYLRESSDETINRREFVQRLLASGQPGRSGNQE